MSIHMRLLILSPHRDDAAFSTGLLTWTTLSVGAHVTIANVYTQSDYAPYAERAGRVDVSELRKNEDLAYARLLQGSVEMIDLGLLDAPLRRRIPCEEVLSSSTQDQAFHRDVTQLVAQLQKLAMSDLVLAPCGIGGHLDHLVCRAAAQAVYSTDRLGYYADLPYHGNFSPSDGGFSRCTVTCSDGPEIKTRLAGLYPSQISPQLATEIGLREEELWLQRGWVGELQTLLGHQRFSAENCG